MIYPRRAFSCKKRGLGQKYPEELVKGFMRCGAEGSKRYLAEPRTLCIGLGTAGTLAFIP